MDSARPRLEVMASDPGTQLTFWPGAGCSPSACSQACRGQQQVSGAEWGCYRAGLCRLAQKQQQYSWPGGAGLSWTLMGLTGLVRNSPGHKAMSAWTAALVKVPPDCWTARRLQGARLATAARCACCHRSATARKAKQYAGEEGKYWQAPTDWPQQLGASLQLRPRE